MKDKADYESARNAYVDDIDGCCGTSDIHLAAQMTANWSRRFCYTEDKVIAELYDRLSEICFGETNCDLSQNKCKFCLARLAFTEEKKKWSGENNG